MEFCCELVELPSSKISDVIGVRVDGSSDKKLFDVGEPGNVAESVDFRLAEDGYEGIGFRGAKNCFEGSMPDAWREALFGLLIIN